MKNSAPSSNPSNSDQDHSLRACPALVFEAVKETLPNSFLQREGREVSSQHCHAEPIGPVRISQRVLAMFTALRSRAVLEHGDDPSSIGGNGSITVEKICEPTGVSVATVVYLRSKKPEPRHQAILSYEIAGIEWSHMELSYLPENPSEWCKL